MKYTIVSALVPKFVDKLNSFKKKHAKYGESELKYEIGEGKLVYVNSLNKYINMTDIEVDGSYKINDYEFVASLEYIDEKGENLIKTISSDVEIPRIYYTRSECDHCKVNRYRKYTVLLRNTKTGEFIQVGKSCVKDYLGVDICNYASYLSIWKSLDEYMENLNKDSYGLFSSRGYGVNEILTTTLSQVRHDGYISKNTAYETGTCSTASRVYHVINKDTDRYGKPLFPDYEITDEDNTKAEAIIKFINNCEDNSAYTHDLQLLLSFEAVSGKNLGLVVSAVGYYLREINKNIEKAKKIASQYVGNVGDKITFTATPNCVYSDYNDYGIMYIYKFTVDNNEIIWKTSKYLGEKEVTIKATIKEHSDFRGNKQTVITRGRII